MPLYMAASGSSIRKAHDQVATHSSNANNIHFFGCWNKMMDMVYQKSDVLRILSVSYQPIIYISLFPYFVALPSLHLSVSF